MFPPFLVLLTRVHRTIGIQIHQHVVSSVATTNISHQVYPWYASTPRIHSLTRTCAHGAASLPVFALAPLANINTIHCTRCSRVERVFAFVGACAGPTTSKRTTTSSSGWYWCALVCLVCVWCGVLVFGVCHSHVPLVILDNAQRLEKFKQLWQAKKADGTYGRGTYPAFLLLLLELLLLVSNYHCCVICYLSSSMLELVDKVSVVRTDRPGHLVVEFKVDHDLSNPQKTLHGGVCLSSLFSFPPLLLPLQSLL